MKKVRQRTQENKSMKTKSIPYIKTRYYSVIALLLLSASIVVAKEHTLKTTITDVTVFQTGAQVKRVGTITIPAGEHQIVVKDATALLLKESIQVKGEGNFTILSVNHQENLTETDNQKTKWTELENKQKELMRKMEELSVKIQVLNAEETAITNLSQITTQTKGVTVEQMAKAQETIRIKLTEIKNEKLKHSRAVLDLFDQHKEVSQQLVSLKSPKQQISYEIVIKVFAKNEVKGNFDITYIVPNARWYPTYDLRVKDVASPMLIEYKANVSQESGEDWSNVKLKLSTGDPSQSSQKPKLETWMLYLNQNYVQPRTANNFFKYTNARFTNITGLAINAETGAPIPWCSIYVPGTNVGTTADADGKFDLVLPMNATQIYANAIGYQAQTIEVTDKSVTIKLYKQEMALNQTVKTDYDKQLAILNAPTVNGEYEGRLYGLDVPVDPVTLGLTGGTYMFGAADAAGSASYGYSTISTETLKKELAASSVILQKLEAANAPVASKTLNVVSTEFSIEERYTVLSDPKYIVVTIESITAPASYQYYCAPRYDQDVFLNALLVNWEQYNLLEGQANVFFEGTFIGNTFFDTRYLVDTLNVSLGRDKSLRVERKKSKEFSKHETLGNENIDYRYWDLAVRNSKATPIEIIIEDQFPVSADSKLEVIRGEKGDGKLDENTGIVTWNYKLDPSTTKSMKLQYKVKYPKNVYIGLD